MGKLLNLTGQKFNRLTAIKIAKKTKRCVFWECLCDCGKKSLVGVGSLRSGHKKSCGCLWQEIMKVNKFNKRHGLSRDNFYVRYHHIIQRCTNKTTADYSRYGGAGIKCEWKNFLNFKEDMYESFVKHCFKFGVKNTQIDRINFKGNYSKINCRWVTIKEQQNNRSSNHLITFNGKTMNMLQWAEKLNLKYTTLRNRICNLKWSIEKSFNEPIISRISTVIDQTTTSC